MPEAQDEREGIPARMDVVAPPGVAQPQADSGGTGGFISQGGAITPNWSLQQSQAYSKQLAAQDAAKAERIAQLQDQAYLEQVRQSAGVEDAIKATAAARKFIAQRRFGRDLSAARASGLPDDQALAHALTKNAVDLFGDHPEHIPAMLKAVTPPGQTHMVPASGGMPPYLVDPRGTPHFAPQPKAAVSPSTQQEIKWRDQEITEARKQIDEMKKGNPAWDKMPETKQYVEELEKSIETNKNAARKLLGGQAPEPTASKGTDSAEALVAKANAAIKKGANPQAVAKRLKELGIDFQLNQPTPAPVAPGAATLPAPNRMMAPGNPSMFPLVAPSNAPLPSA